MSTNLERCLFGLAVVLLLVVDGRAGAGGTASSTHTKTSVLESAVDRLFKPLVDDDLVSGSVLIARRGHILLAKGYGLASREHDVPCGPETPFNIASITKVITGIAVMQLVERGEVGLDDPVARWLPQYPNGRRITVRHLLTHTSGIPSTVFLPDYICLNKKYRTLDEVIADFRDAPLDFEPGSEFRYSNSGYTLLTKIIEVASGSTYESYLQDNIFRPAGMNHSGLDKRSLVLAGRASGYSRGESGEVIRPQYRDPTMGRGEGGLYSTVIDMHKLDRALDNGSIVTPSTLSEMTRPFVQTGGRDSYAHSWFVGERWGHRVTHHPGASFGFMTSYQRFPDDSVTVIAFLNRDFMLGEELFDRLAAIALGEAWRPLFAEETDPADRAKLESFAGDYEMEPSGRLSFFVDGDQFHIQEEGHDRQRAFSLSASRLYCKRLNALIRFEEGQGGNPPRLVGQFGVLRWVGKRASP